ncbi:MAG: protein translocase subunit SecD [Myxococcales bacterium]|nr:protein translocase subunit SecD [Myxococcales bacterium]
MGGRSRWRGIGLVFFVALFTLMLVPTTVDFVNKAREKEGQEAISLPEWFSNIFDQKMVLGLDLQGGIHLQYKVDIEEALKRKAVQTAGAIENALKDDKQIEVHAQPQDGATADEVTTIKVVFPTVDGVAAFDQSFINKYLPSYEISDVTDNVVTVVMSDRSIEEFRDGAVDQAVETIERRINAFGVAESTISKRGESELVVQLPGIKEEEFAAAKEKLAQTGQLHFQIVDQGPAREEFYRKASARKPTDANWPAELDPALKIQKIHSTNGQLRSTSREIIEYMIDGQYDADHLVGFKEIFVDPKDAALEEVQNLNEQQQSQLRKVQADADTLVNSPFVLAYEARFMLRKEGMSGENVTDASVGYDQFNRPVVHMVFDQVDADKFYEMTKKHTKELMAIMIDEIVYSAPRIREPIPGGRVQIEMGAVGNRAFREASALVAVLKSGALQAPLRKLYDSQVGPTLGQDSIEAGRLSMIIGFLAVVVFMGLYYKFAGLVANFALLLNVVFVLGGLTAFGATLTLPGIAGIVLTIGMAVDANVLIFERIREELRAGRSVRKAIDAGYEKAFSAIFDANVTTGIAAVVLYQFGSGPIRGFAVTLGIGIISSLYTALVATRLVFNAKYGRGSEPTGMSI